MLVQDYSKISDREAVVRSAMGTINNLCHYTRRIIIANCEEACLDSMSINFVSSTDVCFVCFFQLNVKE